MSNFSKCIPVRGVRLFVLLAAVLSLPFYAGAVGTWVPLNNYAPDFINTMLLLPDGTVMAAGGQPSQNTFSQAWYRLTPDATGSYVNGTWTTLASMHYPRLYYSSQILTNGQVFIAGAEYSTGLFSGPGTTNAEIYNPAANTWTILPGTPGYPSSINAFYDSCSEMLPGGNVLVSPVSPATFGGTLIWNTASNTWSNGPKLFRGDNEDESTWVKLPDNSVLMIDPPGFNSSGTNSERYIPSLNKFVNDTNVPVTIYDSSKGEMGTALLLPNGQAFFTGATGHSALYTPSGTTNMGVWAAGPDLPNSEVMADAPGAMMVNGKALLVTSSNVYSQDTSFYEYDPVANSYSTAPEPSSYISMNVTFGLRMLALPDGTILLSNGGNLLYVYRPDGTPLPAGQPGINSLTQNANGSYHLTGTNFNGITEGATYGDDAQMNSNYPLVRTTNSTGQVIYARTFNWNNTGVMSGTNIVSTDFVMPSSAQYGFYSLVVSANGNASAPMTFIYSPDTLLISYTNNSLLLKGTNGGPFTPTSVSFTLTNVGASSLNWKAGSSVSWLTPSATSGTLTPGGPTTTMTVNLNSAANSLAFGTYNGNILFTNTSDNVVQTNTFTLVVYPPQLVQNGGFETGNFNNWTQSGNDGYEFVYNSASFAHSGSYSAQMEPHSSLYYLSQNITTTPGQVYLVSFWILTYFTVSPSQFLVNWAGTNLVNLSNVAPNYGYTQMQYLVTAKGTSSTLQFGILYDAAPGSGEDLGLDDVSVTAVQVPKFQSPTKSNGSVNITWGAMYGQSYQLQYTTNLITGPWNNLGSSTDATGATVNVLDLTPADQQRYYRLILLP